MTAPFTSARQLLERVFPLHQRRSQPPTDWRGPIPLPTPLIAYYQEIGPLDLALPAYGTDFFLPSLARLWDYQAGYRWHGLTGEQLPDWDHRWLVIADQGADPVVLSCDTGAVRYGRHGQGAWELAPFLPDLPTTITCLVTLAGDHSDGQGPLVGRRYPHGGGTPSPHPVGWQPHNRRTGAHHARLGLSSRGSDTSRQHEQSQASGAHDHLGTGERRIVIIDFIYYRLEPTSHAARIVPWRIRKAAVAAGAGTNGGDAHARH